MNKTTKNAFTLIELLVVIAIIAILAAILFPVFAQAKLAAKKAVAISNMKQMVLGSVMYANDYDDSFSGIGTHYPPNPPFFGDYATEFGYVDGWENVNSSTYYTTFQAGLIPYLKNDGEGSVRVDPVATEIPGDAWGCDIGTQLAAYGEMLPDQPFTPPYGPDYTKNIATGKSKGCSSFAMNGIAGFKPTTAMPDPAGTVLLREMSFLESSARLAPWNYYGIWHGANTGWAMIDGGGLDNTYNNGGVFGYSDGHAKYAMRTSIKFSAFGCTGALNNGVSATTTYQGQTYNTTYTGSLVAEQATLASTPWQAEADRNLYCPTTSF
jgi:prepilin-type N-terminal cleavage/methylation domain-containing protein